MNDPFTIPLKALRVRVTAVRQKNVGRDTLLILLCIVSIELVAPRSLPPP